MTKAQLKKALAALPKNASKDQKALLEEIAAHITDEDWQQFDDSLVKEMSTCHLDLAK